jgi:hypothetical protein
MEALQPVLRMMARGDGDEHGHPDIDLLGVEKRDAPLDYAELLELLDPAPARRGGEPDLLADLGHRQSAILLQDVEDFSIHTIKHGRPYDFLRDYSMNGIPFSFYLIIFL